MGTRSSILALVAFATACPTCRAAAQKNDASPDYSKQAVVVETYRTAAAFQNDGTSSRDLTVRVRINSDAGVQQYSVLVFSYASALEKIEVDYVRVTHPGGAVVETPASSIQDESAAITRQAPEYSDYREKHVAVKGLGPVTNWSTTSFTSSLLRWHPGNSGWQTSSTRRTSSSIRNFR